VRKAAVGYKGERRIGTESSPENFCRVESEILGFRQGKGRQERSGTNSPASRILKEYEPRKPFGGSTLPVWKDQRMIVRDKKVLHE